MSDENQDHRDPSHPDEKIVHEYDGIKEADNDLPRWWLATLYVTVAFAAVYWLAAESFKTTPSPRAAYDQEVAAAAAKQAEKLKGLGAVTDEGLVALAKDPKSLEEGRAAYASTCAACHAANGGGGIGPNLTDEFWLHGGAPTKVYTTIKEGAAAKGMPAWGPALGEEKVRVVAAYVLSLKGSKVLGGKPPQGEPEL
jgi:cytochrome c oxidase cbb3-type subunit 3